MKKYIIQDSEAGNIISTFLTMSDAQKALNEYENSDKKDGIYVPGFYELKETEHPQTEEQVKEVDILEENKRLKEVNKLLVDALVLVKMNVHVMLPPIVKENIETALKEANLIK